MLLGTRVGQLRGGLMLRKAMIEDKNFKIGKACSLIKKLKAAELKYNRAQYRVSYYRKIKAAIVNKANNSVLNNKNIKYKNNLKELNKKIEKTRLAALKAQEEYMNLKQKLAKPLNKALGDIDGELLYEKGSVTQLAFNRLSEKMVIIGYDKIVEKAEEHEVTLKLNRLLAK